MSVPIFLLFIIALIVSGSFWCYMEKINKLSKRK